MLKERKNERTQHGLNDTSDSENHLESQCLFVGIGHRHKVSKYSIKEVSNRFVRLVVLKSIWQHVGNTANLSANLLSLSRHIVIVTALYCARQVFQPEKVASLSQTQTNLSETCSPARASEQVRTVSKKCRTGSYVWSFLKSIWQHVGNTANLTRTCYHYHDMSWSWQRYPVRDRVFNLKKSPACRRHQRTCLKPVRQHVLLGFLRQTNNNNQGKKIVSL